jgi:hypothetical protein
MASDFRPGTLDIQMWRNDTWGQAFTITINGSGITIGGVGNNQVTVSKLIDIAKGNYVWDMNVAFSGGVVKTYLQGDFIVYDDVTKP